MYAYIYIYVYIYTYLCVNKYTRIKCLLRIWSAAVDI